MSDAVDIISCLGEYVSAICNGFFDKIKEILQSFPDSVNVNYGETVSLKSLLIALSQLERRYQNLQFVSTKTLFNKQEDLYGGFTRIYSVCQNVSNPYRRSTDDAISTQIAALIECIKCFCRLRCSLLSFFSVITKHLRTLGSPSKNIASLLTGLHTLKCPDNCLGSTMAPMINIARTEAEILVSLLRLGSHLGNLEFLNSLLALKNISDKLGNFSTRGTLSFRPCVQTVDTASLEPSPLTCWLQDFYAALLSKFTLYWYSVLRNVATDAMELPSIIASQNPNIVLLAEEFVSMYEGTSVALFFDAYLQDFAYLGHSYVPPGAAEMYVKSSDAISCVFTMPPTENNTLPPSDYGALKRSVHSLLSVEIERTPRPLVTQQVGPHRTLYVFKVEKRFYGTVLVVGAGFPQSSASADEGPPPRDRIRGHQLADESVVGGFINRLCDRIQLVDLTKSLLRHMSA